MNSLCRNNYVVVLLAVHAGVHSVAAAEDVARYAEIRVIDAATNVGIPLVELATVNHLRFVTDNAGLVAFHEPGLMDREVFFTIRGHGYRAKQDGFGFAGVKIIPRAGRSAEIGLTRVNVAERLCRLTGEGTYRDTLLLGREPPIAVAERCAIAGQDSVQAAAYKGEVHWFWGDTLRMSYPLGLYRTAGAKTPGVTGAFDPRAGIAFQYFADRSGFARGMMPLPDRPEGVIWIDGVCTVVDAKGIEKLIAHYSRRKGLAEELEHGLAVFDDRRAEFLPVQRLPLTETWRFPHGHPEFVEEQGVRWLLCGRATLNVRVPAMLDAILDPRRYEAFTCGARAEIGTSALNTDGEGRPVWRWQSDLPPMGSEAEARLVKTGRLKPSDTRFVPANAADPGERVVLHSGTVRWNAHRKRWVLLAVQLGGKSSHLGEVWYAEAEQPTGPFLKAVRVVTHDKQTFYNVCQHPFLDRDGGRVVHFEGTYTNEFSGNPDRTPRYDYNQILYRLDLNAAELDPARVK